VLPATRYKFIRPIVTPGRRYVLSLRTLEGWKAELTTFVIVVVAAALIAAVAIAVTLAALAAMGAAVRWQWQQQHQMEIAISAVVCMALWYEHKTHIVDNLLVGSRRTYYSDVEPSSEEEANSDDDDDDDDDDDPAWKPSMVISCT